MGSSGAICTDSSKGKYDVCLWTVGIGAMNEVYKAFFGENKPTRSCAEVAKLPKDGLVEIEVVATK